VIIWLSIKLAAWNDARNARLNELHECLGVRLLIVAVTKTGGQKKEAILMGWPQLIAVRSFGRIGRNPKPI